MRLHHLQVSAFGPFAGTEVVDFDALNDAGLFLLTGATGAGKTSILDAVCFALYGNVPGVRGVKALKSQHADERARPEVVLEFSVRERRFRIRRSPEWSRPKQRGTGTRVEKAGASLIEIVDREELLRTSRAAEVGLQVSTLIGMQATQFQQVAMLPQGEFQRFLQASSQDRHDVLQHLFGTDRFARIESWVQERSRTLREDAGHRQQAVERVLDTMAERAEAPLPEPFSSATLAAAVGDGEVVRWADALLVEAGVRLADTRQVHDRARADQVETRSRLEAARNQHRAHARRAAAWKERDALEAVAPDARRFRAALEAGVRAAACAPVLALLDDVEAELLEATHECIRRQAAVGCLEAARLSAVDARSLQTPDLLQAAVREGQVLLAGVRALLPRVAETVSGTRRAAELESALAHLLLERAELAVATARLPEQRDVLCHQRDEAVARAAELEALTLQRDAARARRAAFQALPAARARVVEEDDRMRVARDQVADARSLVLDLTERRLSGMAAELAGGLRDGDPCQVCGSTEHPALAAPASQPVTPAEQEIAHQAHERSQQAYDAARGLAAVSAQKVAVLEGQAGPGDLDRAAATETALQVAVDAAETARGSLRALELRISQTHEALERGAARRAQLDTSVAITEQQLSSVRDGLAQAALDVSRLLGDGVQPSALPDVERALGRGVADLEALQSAVDRERRARVQRDETRRRAEETVTAHGFASVTEVRAAVLPATDRQRLEGQLASRAAALVRVQAVLEDPDVMAVDDADRPDVHAAEVASNGTDSTAAGAARTYHQQEQVAASLQGLQSRLQQALDAWEPLRLDSTRVDAMSKLVRGMGSDNQLQMRLSAYVLARRLDQVLDAANERLAHMRDQRYLLRRTARSARRTGQAGLDLEVLDQWTGDVREPATLSGGETFVVSLALALGLADVVTQEAGGTEIETLFVDEGFGTLDAETLDDVMDRLDGLRAGGRTVGVVSHVTELRSRIAHQLHVDKSPRGSTVRMTTLVG